MYLKKRDDGGSLVVKIGEQWMFVGISSWAYGNCDSQAFPTVFTAVSMFNSWILDKIKY